MNPPQLFFLFLLGLALGSFLNVVIYRLPRGLSLATPGSFCPHCGHRLRWYENLPLLSYLLQKGRCRSCGGIISWRYPLVELTSGLLILFTFERFGWPAGAIFYLFSLLLLAATFIDLEHRIIPDEITLGGLLLGLALSPWNPLVTPFRALVGALCGAGAFYLLGEFYAWLRGREGLGGGDHKLLALIGAFLGPWRLFPVVFLAAASGLGAALFLFLLGRRRLSGGSALPFGPFLALGALATLFLPRGALFFLFPTVY
ncbi:prepilin peptidase [Thermosulfurimonas marina]|uniref:Prepilin leader peptidase/N-methyltransferase n=1 Tax=Thermosulfurimonas marina TaxID=2047767 RepID=A0A6H1WRK7_9BACT|nr:A24 family peptidase [Thermosulfurimonas marina]QJA05855.1 prepilin peptidase [Thermosulfurimonas marina]